MAEPYLLTGQLLTVSYFMLLLLLPLLPLVLAPGFAWLIRSKYVGGFFLVLLSAYLPLVSKLAVSGVLL